MLLEQAQNLAGLGMATCLQLAIDEGIVYGHFKSAAIGRDQGQFRDIRPEVCQHFFRQTDGARCVISHGAIDDGHAVLLHRFCAPFWRFLAEYLSVMPGCIAIECLHN
jgi:hypothetical protein